MTYILYRNEGIKQTLFFPTTFLNTHLPTFTVLLQCLFNISLTCFECLLTRFGTAITVVYSDVMLCPLLLITCVQIFLWVNFFHFIGPQRRKVSWNNILKSIYLSFNTILLLYDIFSFFMDMFKNLILSTFF